MSKENEKYFDELRAFAGIKGVTLSSVIGNLVRRRLENPILSEPPWDLSNYTQKELIRINKLIGELSKEILKHAFCHNN